MKNSQLNPDQQKKRLRWILMIFFITLSLPLYYLLQTVYAQLENEAYFNARQQAENLVDQVEINLLNLLEPEQKRPIAEYRFFNVMENPLLSETSGIKFSPLSEIPPKTEIQGLVGYFQINTDGSFHLPSLPELGEDNLSGLSLAELESRLTLKHKLRNLLSITPPEKLENNNFQANKIKGKDNQYTDDAIQPYKDEFKQQKTTKNRRLKTAEKTIKEKSSVAKKSRLIHFNRNQSTSDSIAPSSISKLNKSKRRKEIVQLPDQSMVSQYLNLPKKQHANTQLLEQESVDFDQSIQNFRKPGDSQSIINVFTMESEVTSLKLLIIGQQYLCFYRYVWHDNNRYTQGFIVENKAFFNSVTQTVLINSDYSRLLLQHKNINIHTSNINIFTQKPPIIVSKLLSPFQSVELILYASRLSTLPGSFLIDILAVSIYLIFIIGLIAFYRLGSKQIDLSKQQQNFISAVSHELKTPLTSIRMYGEMLRSDWVADESKKQNYYDFIYFESERLSRLINNVLQLASLGHQNQKAEVKIISAEYLLSQITAKTSAQIEASGFTLNISKNLNNKQETNIKVDEDAFFQIIINLVDNAIKFSSSAENKQIDIGYTITQHSKQLEFFIRDYGPGIKKQQIKKIFQLFYRSGDELTRTTPGTGIGLALVAQLAESMNASINVVNKQPGAEFRIKMDII